MKINPQAFHHKLLIALLLSTLAITAFADEAVNLDDVGASADFFNPYTFARNEIWILLPVFGLIVLGLHLLPVPRRKSVNKIDQARRFFRGISGEGTATGIIKPPSGSEEK